MSLVRTQKAIPKAMRSLSGGAIVHMKYFIYALIVGTVLCDASDAQQGQVEQSARSGIDVGNQAWIDGVRRGDVAVIAATYAEQAVDCSPEGSCVRGRVQIEQHMKDQFTRLGKASSATVKSWGSSQHGDVVYEWGQAEATFAKGDRTTEKYLTVWQKQADGSWKIYRNLVIATK